MAEKTNLKIDFENEQEQVPVTYKLKVLIRAAAEATLDYEQYRNPAEVSVTFTDNEKIRALNKKFRKIDRATDVLSFPLFDYTGEQNEPPVDELVGMLGDIVISLEQAKKQADEYGHGFEREAAFLCVHSMLHLLG
ncbi:MAG: rRNA maturation RNase YbeY, partial [Clostridia bacterium]|nr:rRNA maturation RNase YbeY [Clostridia bacterium]